MKALAISAHEKNLELCYRIAPSVPAAVVGDPARLKQVLLNLVGNAIKFTQQGEVTITVLAKVHSPAVVELEVCVADTGIGIAPEQQQMIFESFRQADASHTRRFGGTGLGLAISSRLVSLMGGRIWVESESDKGARFYFNVLFKPAPLSLREKFSFPNCSALVIDDNATSRAILQEVLESWDIGVEAMNSPAAGFAWLETHHSGLILVDSEVPDVNCLEVIRSQVPTDQMRCVIVMLTSSNYHDQIVRWREMGVAACLIKPLRRSELANAVAAILHSGVQRPGVENRKDPPSTAPDQSSLRILLAEDNAVNQKFAVKVLEKMGTR